MQQIWFSLLCLSGQILLTVGSLNDVILEISEPLEVQKADALLSGIDKRVKLVDAHENKDVQVQEDAENTEKLMQTDLKSPEASRGRRSAWGRRYHAAPVESAIYRMTGLGRPLSGWRKRGKAEMETSALMAALKELHTHKRTLMDVGMTHKEEEEEEDDDDEDEEDDDEEEEEEEEEEVEEEEEEGEGEGEEEEEEEEPTEAPSNQTEANSNMTWPAVECQTAEREISCRGVGLTQLPLLQNPEATKLDVAGNKIGVVTPHAFLGLPSLETLDLSQNELDDESFSQKPLFNMTSLKKLNLADNQITRIPALPLSLEELRINNNKLSGLTPDCFKGLVNLLNLELQDNTLHEGSVSPSAFSPLQSLLYLHLDRNLFSSIPLGLPASLQVLKIKKNQIYEVRGEPLRDCIHLKELDLSHNHIYEQAVASDAWIRLKSLEALDLSHNQLTSIPVNLPRPLRRLNLQHNRISQLPAFPFRHLKPGLQALHLSHNALKDDGVGRRAFVGTYRSLKELLLDNNYLEEVPRCIRQFKNLQMLRLDSNRIRLMRPWGVCHPRNSGSTLASVHLENNLLKVETLPPRAFSCIIDAKGLILHPQQYKQDGNT